MSRRTVIHYTDYKSPFAYLAVEPTYELEEEFDLEVIWRPYTLDIASFAGSVEERSEEQWRKIKYSYMDMRRFANKRNLTVKGPRRIYNATTASIGMLYAQDQGVFRLYNDSVFKRFWTHDIDLDEVDEIEGALKDAGADVSGFEAFLAGDGKTRHAAIKEEAHKHGVFGVPSYVFEDELFWGCDRIDLLKERLSA
ncbi:MAG: DsbA family protein [Proteobacteria bacterium]|nr:DsbA family protein [Pseudomonadota bacterium]